ncbi:DinB family protein [Streptomyces sp. NPDC090306]|uniref:DinB family protein n=1 Tax=unclassified Streptomyces TaxID=2593676 RepID=UPI0036E4C9B1
MTNERHEPALNADERGMLEGWLDYHRATLVMKCEGLTDEQLRTAAVPPSELSLMGLVRHLAECERGWFREKLTGEDVGSLYCTDTDRDGDFHPAASDTWQDTRAAWQAEVTAARGAASAFALDDLSRKGDGATGEPFSLRWIYTHMIEEYARHNGHADLLRECLDGVTGD